VVGLSGQTCPVGGERKVFEVKGPPGGHAGREGVERTLASVEFRFAAELGEMRRVLLDIAKFGL
jgi:hypothetical protein